jgi:3-keto-disaccharide hydrolase
MTACLRGEEPAKANALTPKEIADGWIMLFDGETTFGWKIDGEAKVKDGIMYLGGSQLTTAAVTTDFHKYELQIDCTWTGDAPKITLGGALVERTDKAKRQSITISISSSMAICPLSASVPAGSQLKLSVLRLRPRLPEPLFNGKDLTGWKQFQADPKRAKSKFSVTPEGWLNLQNGPGDLQTERQFDDFLLQAECITHGKNLNSGIFFRCLPGEYQQGYEAQIHNGFKDGDRGKPIDYGTAAIYRRQPARKVVSNDNEWFTMTVAAHGNHLATWVNGYQVTDFTDERKPNDNARNGNKTGKGAISIQGHDPTTNLSFRNIRIAELPKKE